MSIKPPKIVIPGLKRGEGIPAGYMLGRLPGTGKGPAQLLSPAQMRAAGIPTASDTARHVSTALSSATSLVTSLSVATGGGGGGAMTGVATASVAGSAATTLAVSGLDLNTDERYFIELDLKNATTSTALLSLYYNADTTAANYNRQALTISSTSVTGSRGNDGQIGAMDSNTASTGSGNYIAQAWLRNDIDVHPCLNLSCLRSGNSNILLQQIVHEWRTASTNVTGITISSSVANALAVGSKITIWKVT